MLKSEVLIESGFIGKVILKGDDSAIFSTIEYKLNLGFNGIPLNYKFDDVTTTQDLEPVFGRESTTI